MNQNCDKKYKQTYSILPCLWYEDERTPFGRMFWGLNNLEQLGDPLKQCFALKMCPY